MNDPISGTGINGPTPTSEAEAGPKPPPIKRPEPVEPVYEMHCPNCARPFQLSGKVAEQIDQNCQFCKKPMSILTFPRFTRPHDTYDPGLTAAEGEATCQFFPQLKAEVICDECGCFMSQKATVDWGGNKLCLPCLHNLRENKADVNYRSELPSWDNRGLALCITGPVALVILLKHKNAINSWIPRSSFRWWLAMVLSIVFTALYIGFVAFLMIASYGL